MSYRFARCCLTAACVMTSSSAIACGRRLGEHVALQQRGGTAPAGRRARARVAGGACVGLLAVGSPRGQRVVEHQANLYDKFGVGAWSFAGRGSPTRRCGGVPSPSRSCATQRASSNQGAAGHTGHESDLLPSCNHTPNSQASRVPSTKWSDRHVACARRAGYRGDARGPAPRRREGAAGGAGRPPRGAGGTVRHRPRPRGRRAGRGADRRASARSARSSTRCSTITGSGSCTRSRPSAGSSGSTSTARCSAARRSPKRATAVEVFDKLVAFPSLLTHPNLTIEVLLLREDHIRRPQPVTDAAADPRPGRAAAGRGPRPDRPAYAGGRPGGVARAPARAVHHARARGVPPAAARCSPSARSTACGRSGSSSPRASAAVRRCTCAASAAPRQPTSRAGPRRLRAEPRRDWARR